MRRLFSPYAVLRVMPSASRFFVSAYVARLGMAMFGVAIVVMIATRYDSYGLAGLVSFVGLMSMAIGGPLLARAVDRYGQRRIARPAGLVAVAALLLLAVEAYLQAPAWLLLVTALGNALAPAVGTLVRSRWNHVLERDHGRLHIANSFEQVAEESCFVLGPALAAGLASSLVPEAGLVVAVTLFGAGLLGLLAHRVSEPPVHAPGEAQHVLGAFRVPGLVQLAVTLSLTGAVFGGVDVVVLAYAEEEGIKALGGLLIGFFAFGSLLGGLAFGLVPVTGGIARRMTVSTLALFALLAPLLVVPGVLVLGVNGFVAGLAIAPTLITAMTLCQRLVPAAQLNEGMTIVVTGLLVGVAVGAGVAGQVVETAGAQAGFAVPVAAGGLAGVVALLGRRRLIRAESGQLATVTGG